ncbi:hypothetical protein A3K73_01795 [Candidatus Pacearchaeota archaeon RBG_13_36_9]|nr:MAG: hypothetical protein A3K73_01795 [Candidatus Pacearchaeota archaeon RBG_13_36_9]
MSLEKKFDLRKLNPQSGDLVLLVDNDPETGEYPLLLVFYRFLDHISDSREIGVTLLGEHTCHIDATEALYLAPQKYFFKHRFNFPHTEIIKKSKIKYRPDEGYSGSRIITAILKEMKGYTSYGELMSAQS